MSSSAGCLDYKVNLALVFGYFMEEICNFKHLYFTKSFPFFYKVNIRAQSDFLKTISIIGVRIRVVVPGDYLVSEPSPPLKSFQPRANQSPNELIFD